MALEHHAAPPRTSWPWTLYTWAHVLTLLLAGALVAVLAGAVARLFGDRHGRVAHACIAATYRAIVRLHPRYRLSLSGLEHLPRGPAILCPNHQSLSDVVYLFSLPLAFKWVIKKELFFVPLFGAAMRVAGYPCVDRGDPASARALLDDVARLLAAGIPVLSFPEGTRSADGTLGRFHNGPARMAVQGQVPLVPVGVVGTAGLLPKGAWTYPRDAHVRIHVGPPVVTSGRGLGEVRALTRELRRAVEEAERRAASIDEPRAAG